MAKFIMFDLDGTLIDGVDDLLFAMNELLGVHDLAPLARHDLEAMLGDGTWMLTKRAFAAQGKTPVDATLDELNIDFNARYVATNYTQTRLYENAENVLRALKADGWTIALASNKPEAPCKAILQKLGIADLFTVIAGGDSFEVKKPDGRFLCYILDRLGQPPKNSATTIMVGDHANDMEAASSVGAYSISVSFEKNNGVKHLVADKHATSFLELTNICQEIDQKNRSIQTDPNLNDTVENKSSIEPKMTLS
ncbi:HAD family hydrolase [Thalassospira lucentensis]|uniref:HAD family hydrolase n=1 Tax=Thalassospira lucentensis TaxID=168935 RepID=UPI0003B3A8C8|nr:HAD-IA family hydrolase [Thalassospira lucentensis]